MFLAGKFTLRIAVDPVKNKLYYTNYYGTSVEVMNLETTETTKIVKKTFGTPYGLALDLAER